MAIIDFDKNITTSPFQLAAGSFISPEIAQAQGLVPKQGSILNAPTAQQAAEFEQPPPGVIRERGTLANLQGQTAIKSLLAQSDTDINAGYKSALSGLSSAQAAANEQAKQFIANSTDINALNPFVTAGQSATERLSALSGLAGADAQAAAIASLRQTPGFQFQLDQGRAALERSAASKGLLNSGRFAQELTEYAQGLADTTTVSETNRLQGLVEVGTAAAGQKATIAASIEQQRAQQAAALAAQQAEMQAQQQALLAQTRTAFSSQLATLQSQLSAQQQALAVSRAQLSTGQANFIASQPAVQQAVQQTSKQSKQAAALNDPVVQQLQKELASNMAIANSSVASPSVQFRINEIKSLLSMRYGIR